MATTNIKTMKELVDTTAAPTGNNLQTFYPKTHEKAVIDDNGNTLDSKLAAIIEDAKAQVEAVLDNGAVRTDVTQSLSDAQKAQALANVGINSIDNEPTAGSNNPVRSGGVHNELALGAVYDVSAKNPTAGLNNDGKWESLSALLLDSNLNTLIPTAVRKGGMSIKFVQSSDNKYVQYQLIKDSFSVNPINWVKTEPDYINFSGVCYDFNNNEANYSAFLYCPLKAGETYIILVEKEQSSALFRTSETGSGSPSTYKEQISANYGITEFTPQYSTNYIFFFLSNAQFGKVLVCNKKCSASLFSNQIANIQKNTNLLSYKIITSAAQNAWKPYYIKNGDKLIVYNDTNAFCFLDLREAATGNKDRRYDLNVGINEISISDLPNQVSKYLSIYAGESTADKYIYIIKEENTEISLSQFIPQILQSKNDEVELSGRVTTLENKTNIIKQTLSAEGYTGWVPFNVKNGDTIIIESEAPDGSVIVLFNSTQSSSYAFRAFPSKGISEITATADTKYVRMFFADSAKNKYVRVIKKVTSGSLAAETLQSQADIVQLDDTVKSMNASKVFYVGTGRQYTTIKAGVEAALQYQNSIVYIERGTYDIIQEWGQSVLDEQTETIQNNGIKLYNGIHLIFSSDAKVVCNYTGNNRYACDDFSPFNSLMSFQDEKGGFTIENMNIECSRVRYCVHDERGSRADDRYKHVYKNCKFYIDNSNNPSLPDREWCIGTGLGRDGYIIVEGCEFARGNYYAHNTGNADAKSKIIVKDCIFASGNTVRLDPYGTSTKETDVYVSNCRLGASIIKSQPSSGNPDNIKVIEWNNTIVES